MNFTIEPKKLRQVIETYLNGNLHNYNGITGFEVKMAKYSHSYVVEIYFDRKTAIEMGITINMLIRKETNKIGNELFNFFKGVDFVFHINFN